MTQKRRNIKLKVSDKIILFVSISISLACLVLFITDLTRTQTKEGEETIATVYSKEKIVQRKFLNRLSWDRLKPNSKLYSGDTIRTGDSSGISLELSDETLVNVYSNTMVQLFGTEDGTSISLTDNSKLSIKTTDGNDNLFLQMTNGSVVKVDNNTDFYTETTDNQTSFQVLSGVASFVDSDGNIQNLSNNRYIVNENGEVILSPILVNSPAPNECIMNFSDEKYLLHFSYSILSQEIKDKVLLEISNDKSFNTIIVSKEEENQDYIDLELDHGKYYYKLTLQKENFVLTGNFEIINTKFPTQIKPLDKETVSFDTSQSSVRFIWDKVDEALSYKVEISSNPLMTDLVITKHVNMNSIVINNLAEGTWYWKVSANYDSSLKSFLSSDKISSFNLVKGKRDEGVIIKSPPNGIETSNTVVFSWDDDELEGSYVVKIADNPELENPVMNVVTKNSYFKTQLEDNNFDDKQWYWTLEKVSEEGETIENSDIRYFTKIDSEKQKLLFPINKYLVSESLIENIKFTWTAKEGTFTEYLQIAYDSDFSDIFLEQQAENFSISKINIPVGNWFWRIKSIDSNNTETSTTYSEINEIIVVKPFSPPIISSDYEKEVFVVNKDIPILLTWSFDDFLASQNSNVNYFVEVFDNNDLVFSQSGLLQNEIQFSLDKDYTEKEYVWTVKAYKDESTNNSFLDGDVATSIFQVREPKRIELLEPINNTRIDGLNAFLENTVFKWKSDEDLIDKQFLLIKEDNKKREVISKLNNPKETVTIPKLSEGSYYWMINGKMSNDIDVSSVENHFTITSIKKLGTTKLVEPAKNKVFDEIYFRDNRDVKFIWNKVENATHYYFKIEKKDGTKIIDRTFSQETNFTFEKIDLFDIGEFIWTIQAQRRDKNGRIIQSSDVSQSSFSIDIPLPEKPSIQKKGLFYAY